MSNPTIIVIGGPNGAGKTTVARSVLADTLGITEFVNADAIATGLSGFDPDRAAFAAGRVMLQRLDELAEASPRVSFAFESTLASRTFAPWLASLARHGWHVHLLYIWLSSPALAIRRVAARVRQGGHAISPEVVRRRYFRSIDNFRTLYRPLALAWQVYDNSGSSAELIASGTQEGPPVILDGKKFKKLEQIQ